jgi:peroxiredoxin
MSMVLEPPRDAAGSAARDALTVLLLTSVHHAYGAYVYDTPWRYHVVLISVPAGLVILGSLALLRARPSGLLGALARRVFVLTVVAMAVLMIGLVEGLYNHVVKNAFYFSGVSPVVMARLFPPPTYEMPNDAFFEITGMLQVVPAALAAWHVYRMSAMRRTSQSAKLGKGMTLGGHELMSISGAVVNVPDPDRLVHLQFRRFAGCPVCDLHLRSVVRRHNEIAAAGIREVVVFHSTADELRRYEHDLPFAAIADPDKHLYVEFGVERSPRALLDRRAWIPIMRAVLAGLWDILGGRRPVPPIRPHGGSLGLPADFLVGSDGRMLACKYGVHAADQWSVHELLSFARSETEHAQRLNDERDQRLSSERAGGRARDVA